MLWTVLIMADMYFHLQFIPMPVLYGVFLYMGVASLSGIQVLCVRQLVLFMIWVICGWAAYLLSYRQQMESGLFKAFKQKM